MSIRVAILGASGYGGAELLRILAGHPLVDAVAGSSRRFAGKTFGSVHPNLRGLIEGEFVKEIDWAWLADSPSPVLFCAMPHGEWAARYPAMDAQWDAAGLMGRLLVVDLSADFRIRCLERYVRHYGSAHPCPERLDDWVYGFSEAGGASLAGAKRIANPGCFASALQIGLFPLMAWHGVDYVAATGATGSSGSGMAPSETTHHPTRASDFRAYKMLAHQHMAEVEQMLSDAGRSSMSVSFVPHSAPMVRGILATLQFQLPQGRTAGDLRGRFAEAYAGAKFIRLVDGSPRVAAVAGSNFVDVGVAVQGRNAAVLVALDNLLKGMSGQAVQSMNLALGLDETAGLWFAGGFPY